MSWFSGKPLAGCPPIAVVQMSLLLGVARRAQNALMYLRRHRRQVGSETYEYWTLVESRRTASGPRQHTVANLGKLPGLDATVRAGWESIDELLEGKAAPKQLPLSVPKPAEEPAETKP